MDLLPLEIVTQTCRWYTKTRLVEGSCLINRPFFAAAHHLLHVENEHFIDSLTFESDGDQCLIWKNDQFRSYYAPIPEVNVPANITGFGMIMLQ